MDGFSNDYQRNKVYRWEHECIAPNDRSRVSINNAQAVVNHIWATECLEYPPEVEPLHPNVTKWAGTGSRMVIELQPVVSTKTIVHEVAHSMSSTVHGDCNGHGPWWAGLYLRLLHKYMGLDMPYLLYTLNKHKIEFNLNAYPVFLDR